MIRAFAALMLLLAVTPGHAFYNANIQGVVTGVWTYDDRDSIYVHLDTQPTSHPTCNPLYFVIDPSLSADRRHMMHARLLLAYSSGEVINIGYDNAGNCVEDYIRVHRVG